MERFEYQQRRNESIKKAVADEISSRLKEQAAKFKDNLDNNKENPQDFFKKISDIMKKYPEEFMNLDLDDMLQGISEYFGDEDKLKEFLKETEQNKKRILKDILQIDVPE